MGELKPGWKRVKFGEIAECVNERVDDPKTAGVDRYVGLEHLEPETLTIRSWGTPDEVESTKLRFRPGDIIFGKRRAYQRKLAVADFDGICSAHAMVLRPKTGVALPQFLPFFMQSDVFMERAVAISVGSLSPTINWKTLAQEEFALPPLAEQRRFATRCLAASTVSEELATAVSLGQTARDSLIVQLYSHGTRNESRVDSPIGPIPRSWKSLSLGSRYSVQLGKMISPKAREDGPDTPYLRNANIQWNRLDLDDVACMSMTAREKEKFGLRIGDILACEGRHVGKAAMWRDEIPGATYQKALHRLRALGNGDEPAYLLHCMYFFSITGRFSSEVGETTIPHLPAERLRAMIFPFPPLEEQRIIGEAISDFDRGLDALRARATEASIQVRSILP